MAKFWYVLANQKSNITVKTADKSLVFSKILGAVEHFTDENEILDIMVKKGALLKYSAADKELLKKATAAAEPNTVVKPVAAPAATPEPQPEPKVTPEPQPENESAEDGDESKGRGRRKKGD